MHRIFYHDMRHSPDVLDYEGVFPSKRSRPDDAESMGKGVFKEIDLDKPSHKPADTSEKDDKDDEKPSFMELEAGQWQAKRGHGLTFALLQTGKDAEDVGQILGNAGLVLPKVGTHSQVLHHGQIREDHAAFR